MEAVLVRCWAELSAQVGAKCRLRPTGQAEVASLIQPCLFTSDQLDAFAGRCFQECVFTISDGHGPE